MFRKEPPIAVHAVLLLERQGTLLAEQFALIMDKSLRRSKKVRLLLSLISEPFGHFVSERIVLFCHHFSAILIKHYNARALHLPDSCLYHSRCATYF